MCLRKSVVPLMVLALCGGCVRAPYGVSLDRHNYTSTPTNPVTLNLVDVASGETVWSLDVPVYKKAVIDLDYKHHGTTAQSAAIRPRRVRWGIFEPDKMFGTLDQEQELSGNPVVLKVTVRESPEPVSPPAPTAAATGKVRDARFLGTP